MSRIQLGFLLPLEPGLFFATRGSRKKDQERGFTSPPLAIRVKSTRLPRLASFYQVTSGTKSSISPAQDLAHQFVPGIYQALVKNTVLMSILHRVYHFQTECMYNAEFPPLHAARGFPTSNPSLSMRHLFF